MLNTNYYYYATNSSENVSKAHVNLQLGCPTYWPQFTRYMSDPMGQFEWLNSTLQNCTQLGEKALLVGHVPPGVFAVTGTTDPLSHYSMLLIISRNILQVSMSEALLTKQESNGIITITMRST